MTKQLEVGKTYTAKDGTKWRCFWVNSRIARMHVYEDEHGTAFSWSLDGKPISLSGDHNRIVFEPERGEVVLTGSRDDDGTWGFDDYAGIAPGPHRLTIPTLDGELVTGIYTSPDGHKIKVEKRHD